MAIPTDIPGVAKMLSGFIAERAPDVQVTHDYYNGDHNLKFATIKYREAFGRLLNALADNWCQIVVDASVERLQVEGFRFGGTDEPADDEAWMLWQANSLDADASLAFTEAGMSGIAYMLVTPTDDPETPRISVESPLECVTWHAADDRRKRLAGLKQWVGEDGIHGVLYTPERFYMLGRGDADAAWSVESDFVNRSGVVPLVPMLNNPQLLGTGVSDLNVVMPLQDAVNKLLADMVVNSEFTAFPQRWATGIEIPRDEDGRLLDRDSFLSAVSRLWVAEDEQAKFGELAGDDGLGYVRNIEVLIQHIAAQTRTPPHYLLGQSGNFPSGESLKATETGLVAKAKRKQVWFGETLEEAMRIAFAFRGDTMRSQAVNAETIWRDPESRSEGELVDALLKMRQLSVPLEALWQRWGVSPQQIKEWKTLTGLPDRPPPGATGATTNATNLDQSGSNPSPNGSTPPPNN